MTTLHMDTETTRSAAREMARGGEQLAQSVQALNRSVRALRTAWVGGGSEEFGIRAQELVAQMDALANTLTELAGRADREAAEWEETDRRGAGAFQTPRGSGGAAAVAGISVASLLAGLPAWLRSLLDRFFPPAPVVSPLADQKASIAPLNATTTTPATKSKFGELMEKAKKEAEQKKKEKESKPKYISQYKARDDDGTYLVGQEKSDSCSIASTKMALYRAAGIDAKESDLRDASKKLDGGYKDNTKKWGTSPASLDDLVNTQYGDKASAAYNGVGTQSVDDLKKAADGGQGIVVSVKNSEWFGEPASHSVTVVDVKTEDGKQVVLVNDPWPPGEGKRIAVPADDFKRAWHGDALYVSKK